MKLLPRNHLLRMLHPRLPTDMLGDAQVHPPDVTGAQLVGADGQNPDASQDGYAVLTSSMHGSAAGVDPLLFPTVDDMSPSSRASDSPHGAGRGAWFGGARAKLRKAVGRGSGGEMHLETHLEMKDVEDGAAHVPVGSTSCAKMSLTHSCCTEQLPCMHP